MVLLVLAATNRRVSTEKQPDTKGARNNTENNDSEGETEDGKHTENDGASNVKKRTKNNRNYEMIDETETESLTNKRKSIRNAAIEDMNESTGENIAMENVSSGRIGNVHERGRGAGDDD